LFERHIMRRQLVAAGHAMDATHYNLTDPNIVNPKPGGYVGGAGEWDRLARAIEINRPAALESASWGLFQIMGFHWKLLGFASVQAFVNAM
ncbi:N-acetylmuramidase domain-containing protein, partial [Escherichia coli]|uniref:N-acetylmuramidase domain-containing protein n=1 Tax=Escherichia coli TaxID=562 RepID=UPI003C117636